MKKGAYLLPAMPALTLLAAAGLAAAARMRDTRDELVLRGHFIAAIVLLAALIYWPRARMLAAALLIVAVAAMVIFRSRNRGLGMIVITALMFAASLFVIENPLMSDFLNQWSDAPVARAIRDRVGSDQPLQLIGLGLREDVLFYLGGRTVPRVESVDQLPADFSGFAIVTAEQYDSVRKSGRGKELSASADRRPDTRMYFFEFGAQR